MIGTNKKVLLAMSGGIDSTVAAVLLQEQGYTLEGVTFRPYDSIARGCWEKETGCCSVDTIMEAKNNARSFGIPHHVLDIRESFKKTVIANFIQEYMAGRTPNPCVLCNSFVKWGKLLELANELGCRYIATGHYANVQQAGERFFLSKGKDLTKDQTYFLWTLTQDNLQRTLFPLGHLHKQEVRDIASQHGMERLVKKRESQEVCFIQDNDYRRFLREHVPDMKSKVPPGNFVDVHGKILGQHEGYPFYTIGQRKGLKIALGYPAYVLSIDPLTNTVVLGERALLLRNEILVNQVNCMKIPPSELPEQGVRVQTKIRYNTHPADSTLYPTEHGMKLVFDAPVSAVTPGQSAVFYQGNDVLGGGIIVH